MSFERAGIHNEFLAQLDLRAVRERQRGARVDARAGPPAQGRQGEIVRVLVTNATAHLAR